MSCRDVRPGTRLRGFAAGIALAAAGVLAAVVTGPGFGAISLPTLPTVTLSTPITTTTVSIDPPPAPTPPPPVTLPVTSPPPPSPSPSPPPPSPSPSPSSPPPSAGGGGSTGSVSSAPGSGSSRNSSRAGSTSGATTPRRVALTRKGSVTFTFRLRAQGRVVFVLRRLGCAVTRKFAVRGHSGLNRIRFRGRVHGRPLPAGTYRVRAWSHGKTVLRTKLVVRGSVTFCFAAGGASSDDLLGIASVLGGSPKQPGHGRRDENATSGGPSASPAPTHDSGGVLGAQVSKVIPGSGETQLALLIVLLGAILLLAVGAVPRSVVPHPGAAAFVARRRAIFTAGGLAALGAFLISYFIG
jgi:hypothetical protein